MATVIILTIVIVAVIVVVKYNMNKKLVNEGKIVARKGSFWEEEHLFATAATYETVRDAIGKTSFSDCKASVYPDFNGQKSVLFKSKDGWNAEVDYVGEQGGKNQFKFSFLVWHDATYSMNMILTTIEKLFLSLDPAVTVQTRRMQIKTKTKI